MDPEIITETVNLNIVISIVIMTYVAFNFYFMLEKYKVRD